MYTENGSSTRYFDTYAMSITWLAHRSLNMR